MQFLVLTGFAGAGKTEILHRLAAAREQVLDLEALAAHRGSAFGRIGIDAAQPSQAEFRALVRSALAGCDPGRPVWLEDEGSHIGSLWLPDEAVAALAAGWCVEVKASFEERVARLVATYGHGDPDELVDATQRMRRRLGNPRTDRAISHFHAGRPEAAIRVLLDYFDDGYALRSARRAARPLGA
jgi:tRNA 2-selenouridine synthase